MLNPHVDVEILFLFDEKNILKDLSSSIFYDKKYTLFSMIGDDVISFLDRMSTNDINQKNLQKQSLLITKDQLLILFHIKL